MKWIRALSAPPSLNLTQLSTNFVLVQFQTQIATSFWLGTCSKVVFHSRLSSNQGCFPSYVVFHPRLSSIQGCLTLNVIFHPRLLSIHQVVFHPRLPFIQGNGCLPSKQELYCLFSGKLLPTLYTLIKISISVVVLWFISQFMCGHEYSNCLQYSLIINCNAS